MLRYTHDIDVVIGLIKAFIYGGIIALIGCYKGLTCGVGAEGVGRATTEAVVYSSITILICEFFPDAGAGQNLRACYDRSRAICKKVSARSRCWTASAFGLKTANRSPSSGAAAAAKAFCSSTSSACCSRTPGEVLIDGENIVPMNERQLLRVRRKFGMVFQGAALFDSMTVAENVAFGVAPA